MSKKQHLTRAPIREAVIDIQFGSEISLERLGAFAQELSRAEGRVSDVWTSTVEIKVEADGPQEAHTAVCVGKRIDFTDAHQVIQLRSTGFTFSRLPPYESWETMSDRAYEVWSRYLAEIPPVEIVRLAVRYINALRIPLPLGTLDEYLSYTPQIPRDLPQTLSGFLNRVVINDQENDDIAIITQMLEGETPDHTGLNVLLDIDVAHPCKIEGTDLAQITVVLNRLRDLKNRAFFGFLEEKILEQYI